MRNYGNNPFDPPYSKGETSGSSVIWLWKLELVWSLVLGI